MRYAIGILVAGLLAFATVLPLVRTTVFSVADKIPVLLAVLVAAVLVRLARGMPTIPFEKIKPAQALTATAAFRLLLQAYTQSLVVVTIALFLNLISESVQNAKPWSSTEAIYAYLLMFFDIWTIIVVYFLVSADMRISHIQADLMDQVTGASSAVAATASAQKVRDAFKEAPRDIPSATPL